MREHKGIIPNRGRLTKEVELNDLLSFERAEMDGADVAPLVPNLKFGQSHRGVAVDDLADVQARAPTVFVH